MDRHEFNYRFPHFLRSAFLLTALLLVFIAIASFVSRRNEVVVEAPAPSIAENVRKGIAPIPMFTEATQSKLEKGPVFHALVSYVDTHFEPAVVTIQKGQTVRFTNNASSDVWIAAHGANVEIYPRTNAVCGSSDLDSCEAFAPQDFWQFTFDTAGEWEVINNLDKSKGAKIIVEN